jgi:hypothetical protein
LNKVLSLERNVLAGLVVAAALAVMPTPSGNTPTLLASVSFSARAGPRKRVTAMTYYGTFEGFPATWDSGADYGFVLWKDSEGWRRIPTIELNHGAGVMSKAKFEKEFPNLPPLSKLAR